MHSHCSAHKTFFFLWRSRCRRRCTLLKVPNMNFKTRHWILFLWVISGGKSLFYKISILEASLNTFIMSNFLGEAPFYDRLCFFFFLSASCMATTSSRVISRIFFCHTGVKYSLRRNTTKCKATSMFDNKRLQVSNRARNHKRYRLFAQESLKW